MSEGEAFWREGRGSTKAQRHKGQITSGGLQDQQEARGKARDEVTSKDTREKQAAAREEIFIMHV